MESNVKSSLWSGSNSFVRLALGFSLLFAQSQRTLAQETIQEWIAYFQTTYDLEVLVDSSKMRKLRFDQRVEIPDRSGFMLMSWPYGITYQADEEVLLHHLQLLRKELEVYPTDYFRKIDLNYLCLVQEAKFFEQRREAIPDPLRKALLLESSHRLKNDTTYLKHAFHHDLFHYAETTVSRQHQRVMFSKWEKLNPKGFKYRGSGAMQYNPKYAHVDWFYIHPREGFITNYAMTDEGEDRAEVAAHLLIPEKRKLLFSLFPEDKVLRKKVSKITDFLMSLGVQLELRTSK